MKTNMKHILLGTALFSAVTLQAQIAGAPDSSFGVAGRYFDDMSGNNEDDWGSDAVVLQDTKILIVGSAIIGGQSDICLMRLKPSGERDSTFGTNGISLIDLSLGGEDNGIRGLQQPDGKLLVCGNTGPNYDVFIARLNQDGSFDTTFNSTGYRIIDNGSTDDVYAMALRTDGSIILAGNADAGGTYDLMFAAVTSSGQLDNSFSTDGIELIDAGGGDNFYLSDMVLNPAGEIFFCGGKTGNYGLAGKLHVNGGLDSAYATNGLMTYQHFASNTYFATIKTDASGKAYLSGKYLSMVGETALLCRLTSAGVLDNTFDTDGAQEMYLLEGSDELVYYNMAITAEGILCGNHAENKYITVMYHTDGSLNTNYGTGGVAANDANASFNAFLSRIVNLDANRVLLAGHSNPFDSDLGLMVLFIRDPQTVSVNEIKPEMIGVYPNPATDLFHLNIPANEQVQWINLYTAAGQLVHVYTGHQSSYTLPAQIVPGTYILQVRTNNTLATQRICILK